MTTKEQDNQIHPVVQEALVRNNKVSHPQPPPRKRPERDLTVLYRLSPTFTA